MAQIKPIDVIAKKWATVTPQRSADYDAGVRSPRRPWAAATTAAADAWKAGIQSAITRNAFSKGVAKAGDAAWSTGAIEKGTRRWGEGVALAEDRYSRGFAPYAAAIARVTLPPRYARRDPRNLERVKAIVDAMVKVKEGSAG